MGKTVTYLNNYQLGPKSKPIIKHLFNRATESLNEHCGEYKYDSETSRDLVCELCDILNSRLRKLLPPRYRLIVQVIITQKMDQDYQIGTKWLWNEEHDNHTTANLDLKTCVITAIVHTIYTE